MQVGTLEKIYTQDDEDYTVVYQLKEVEKEATKISMNVLGKNLQEPISNLADEKAPFCEMKLLEQESPPLDSSKMLLVYPTVINSMDDSPIQSPVLAEEQDLETKIGCFSWFECAICKKIQEFFKKKKKTILKHLD